MDNEYLAERFKVGDLTVSVYQEQYDCPNPRKDWDPLGHMVCWHRRADLGDETIRTDDYESMDDLVRSFDARIVLPLYLYEHGGMTMSVGNDRHPFTDPWDSGQVGFIYMTADEIRKTYLVKRITKAVTEQVRASLIASVEEYDAYLRGECYYFTVEDIYDNVLESCGGFLGDVLYCIDEARATAEALNANALAVA